MPELRESIQELSLTLVLGEPSDGRGAWRESVERSLAAISECSRQANWEDGLRISEGLEQALQAGGPDLRECLSTGTIELQRLFEQLNEPVQRGPATTQNWCRISFSSRANT